VQRDELEGQGHEAEREERELLHDTVGHGASLRAALAAAWGPRRRPASAATTRRCSPALSPIADICT
jgi:hypothetical protein